MVFLAALLFLATGVVGPAPGGCVEPGFRAGLRTVLPVGGFPRTAVVADLQGKGRDDLAVIKDARDTVSVLFNDGLIGFALPLDIAVGSNPIAIAAGDVNGDGFPDLITVNYLSNDVSVVMNRGDGTLDPERRVQLGAGTHPLSLALGDFDGDGSLDIAITFQGGGLSILSGRGNGDFSFSQSYAIPNAWGVAVSDFNRDGRLDLAVAGWDTQGQVTILYGAPDGHFQPGPVFPLSGFPEEVVVADFNADGLPDLAVTARDGQGISLLLADGKGSFSRNQIQNIRYPIGITVGDFNRDGRLDLAFGNAYDRLGIYVAPGDGAGGFGDPIRFSEGYGRPVGSGDFSGGGTRDLAIANSNGILLFIEGSSGGFVPPEVPSVHYRPSSLALADFNKDGLADLAVGTAYSSEVQLILGQSGGGFADVSSTPVGGPVRSLGVADFDGDGKPDLVVARGPDSCASPPEIPRTCPKQAIVILLNRGTQFEFSNEIALENDPAAVAVADLNRDGLPDLVVVDPGSDRVLVFLNIGSGSFGAPRSFTVGRSPRAVAIADFDGDGKLDLAVANHDSNDISLLLGRADGTFTPALTVPGGEGPVDVIAADFDRDGRMDLAVASAGSKSVTLMHGLGDGKFDSGETLPVAWTPGVLAVGDFKGDGYPELAVTNVSTPSSSSQQRASYVSIFDVHSPIHSARSFPVGLNPVALAASDLNSDGWIDLVTANADSDDISILLSACSELAPTPVRPRRRVPRSVSAH